MGDRVQSSLMWDWLVQNKQWVFSGVGVAVLGSAWWIVKKLGSRREPMTANTVTQSPVSTVTQSPTININVPRSPQPPKQEPPAPAPSLPAARANLKIETTKLGKVYLQEAVFRTSLQRGSTETFRGLFVDVANAAVTLTILTDLHSSPPSSPPSSPSEPFSSFALCTHAAELPTKYV